MAGPIKPFTFHDGERTVHFGRGSVRRAVDAVGGPGYVLLTTERALRDAAALGAAAGEVVMVRRGPVDQIAGELLSEVGGDRLVALGGGRVIDAAKALAAHRRAEGDMGVQAMAIPTTLSGAEMTHVHRRAAGSPPGTRGVRPSVVVNDPELSASQPEHELAASAANALGHAVEAPCTVRANPISTLVAHEAARHLVSAFRGATPDRDAAALGALLAAYAMDSTGYGLHHVLSQTLVRHGGASHGGANAVLLPHTIRALAWRCPDRMAALEAAIGRDPAAAALDLATHSGATTLTALGVGAEALPGAADAAAERADLDGTPPRASRAEILTLYEHAL
jgi:alcohol dehydrogenase class IV